MRAENHTQVRAPLGRAALRRALVRPGGLWRDLEVVESTGSTNADLLTRALAGEPEGAVLAAEEQRAGRGRMGRTWTSPPRAALTFSVLLKPAVPPARRGWLPLLAGVAVATAVTQVTGVETGIKWPNDLLTADAKLAGILAEASGDAVVVGIGLNVSTEPAEFPPARPGALPATSLRAAGATALDRASLLLAILGEFEHWYRAWQRAGGDPDRSGLSAEYTGLSATIGRAVRAELPGGQALSGPAAGVDSDGRLLVRVSSGSEVAVSAGDVVHLR
ncbi:MAG TPA: biotin--[acetyl-CoA-carboxylase] ligase [Streptosporangiaceae bacterium]|jgi:BirA family biotin operon repressor/biotin-[acetyl-CoA-carboxylase] ligase|nr:biotin--[acetyl-CoA-carboxylase] ligase [Streptosporangiaceae bacterium]